MTGRERLDGIVVFFSEWYSRPRTIAELCRDFHRLGGSSAKGNPQSPRRGIVKGRGKRGEFAQTHRRRCTKTGHNAVNGMHLIDLRLDIHVQF